MEKSMSSLKNLLISIAAIAVYVALAFVLFAQIIFSVIMGTIDLILGRDPLKNLHEMSEFLDSKPSILIGGKVIDINLTSMEIGGKWFWSQMHVVVQLIAKVAEPLPPNGTTWSGPPTVTYTFSSRQPFAKAMQEFAATLQVDYPELIGLRKRMEDAAWEKRSQLVGTNSL
jgi:hypothetical protein